MNLTKEQKAIITCASSLKQGQILKINACAGSGKTATLKQIALANPSQSFLYLAFNKAIAKESAKSFPKNVEVKTIHALAYTFAKKYYENFRLHNSSLKVFDIAFLFPHLNTEQLSVILKSFNDYVKSDAKNPIYYEVAQILNAMIRGELGFTHDFYLKLYSLASEQVRGLNQYDYILLDEAQDSNAPMLSIFLKNTCRKILVGDTFQNIYGFNKTINALEIVEADFSLNLSKSFRSVKEILNYADGFLDSYSNKARVKMKSAIKKGEEIQTQAYITRTNAGLIELLNLILENEEDLDDFRLLKDPDDIFRLLFDIFAFRANRFDFISKENAFLCNFNSMFELRTYASYDAELSKALNLSYKDYDFKALKNLAKNFYKNSKGNSFLINAHLSKGLEWDRVILWDDFPSLKNLKTKIAEEKNEEDKAKRLENLEQELNLFYVAITRARFELIDESGNE